MFKNRKAITLWFVCVLLTGCIKFKYHPYDGNINGPTDINATNIRRIEMATLGKTTIRFAFIGDTQRSYDETVEAVNHINRNPDIDFVMHGGDITDFGLTDEFVWMRDILNKLNKPYVVLIGNHDCLANGEEVFEKIFGKLNFSFVAGNIKFVCLNTNALEADYSKPIPDFLFLNREIEKTNPTFKTIVAMHAKPYTEQFNNNVAEVFQYIVNQFPNLQFCLNAHNHSYDRADIFNDGIIYYGTPNIKKRQYLNFTITPQNTTHELVSY